jgi:hypothetical protein
VLYGIKAILFVFETTRLSPEQRETLEVMRNFLRNNRLRNYAITVFSKPTKSQMMDPDEMQHAWNITFTDFIGTLDYRWGISPNSDYFDPNHRIHRNLLGRIKWNIARISGVYTTERYEEIRQLCEADQRLREDEEDLAERERMENEQNIGTDEARRIYNHTLLGIEQRSREREQEILMLVIGIGIFVLLSFMYMSPISASTTTSTLVEIASFGAGVIRRIFNRLRREN